MFNQAFAHIKWYEFNLTLKKAVLRKGICIKKKWMKLEQGTKSK